MNNFLLFIQLESSVRVFLKQKLKNYRKCLTFVFLCSCPIDVHIPRCRMHQNVHQIKSNISFIFYLVSAIQHKCFVYTLNSTTKHCVCRLIRLCISRMNLSDNPTFYIYCWHHFNLLYFQ